jgi:ADP-ribosylglycohydrolase
VESNILRNIETSIINSALWSAAGDAVGWISELTTAKGLERRAGNSVLSAPVKWKRKIGGTGGVIAALEAGTYSDDTQLRLAVSRSIRGDGIFDVEPFAKIELPVWLSYALGAGKGSKAAAANLIKRDVNWLSNFFTYDGERSYVDAGGNGAAMRIQPHVWQYANRPDRAYVNDVVKDALVTHGNMRGVCGALFHADCLAWTLGTKSIPSVEEWHTFVENFHDVASVIFNDSQLDRFWLPTWEEMSGRSIGKAIEEVIYEMHQLIEELAGIRWNSSFAYADILDTVGAFSSERKGTGTNTALAAAALAWDMKDADPKQTILTAANAIGSDTDTIATMAGALIGVLTTQEPDWPIQDHDYIVFEAQRMAALCLHKSCSTYVYPDLFTWQPPQSQSDAIGIHKDQIALLGFGHIVPIGPELRASEFAWRWFKLPFGQTVLCKYRIEIRKHISVEMMPGLTRHHRSSLEKNSANSLSLFPSNEIPLGSNTILKSQNDKLSNSANRKKETRSIDDLSNIAIQSNFDPTVIGECLLECLDSEAAIEKGIGYTSIILKALIARKNKGAKIP